MKKLLGLLFVAFGFMVIANSAEAASARGGSRTMAPYNYSTTVSTVSIGPAALYQVILSTGAASEYIALFDAASVGSLTSANTGSSFRTRLFYAATSTNTVVTFDPPIQFNRGIMVGGSAVTGQALFVYESGRPRE